MIVLEKNKMNALLTDISLQIKHRELRPVYEFAAREFRVPGSNARYVDTDITTGKENLAQAITMRLLTPKGEMASLGHPEYGSRLHELIGQANTATKYSLAKLYILESLGAESRIEKITDLVIAKVEGTRGQVKIVINVKPKGETDIVKIGPFALEF